MPQNGPRGHDSLYENMISMDLQEIAPDCKIDILGQMSHNGSKGHGSLYENMISMDLQESAPEYTIYKFLARCPRTAPEAMILSTKT